MLERQKRKLENEKLANEVFGIRGRHEEVKGALGLIFKHVDGVYNDFDRAFRLLAENREFKADEVEELVRAIRRFVGQMNHRPKFEAAAERLKLLQAPD